MLPKWVTKDISGFMDYRTTGAPPGIYDNADITGQ